MTTRRFLPHDVVRPALLGLMVVALALASLAGNPMRADSATPVCVVSPGKTTAYSVKVCLASPAAGATLTGDATVTATVTITGTSPGLAKIEFSLNNGYLLTDFQSPYTFTLRTTDFVDGTYTLDARANLRDGYVPPPTSVSLAFSNGITSPPVNSQQWDTPTAADRTWREPTILAATGDGAGGEANAANVIGLMDAWNPDLVAYTGDVYEKGTITEFRNWFGTSGTWWSKFRDRTLPVIGNHEYTANQAPGYFDYWDNIPHYYSVDVNGWHIIGIDTTSQYDQTDPGTDQYEWLQADLAANSSPCTIVTGHHPLFNIGKETPAVRLQPMWQLMADHGVTMFLVGHDHTYQRWAPLDGAGNPSSTGVTELVVGTGGHSSQAAATSDFRVLKYSKSYGAARLALYGDRMEGLYQTTAGTVVETFTIPCTGADGIAPDPVAGLTGTAADSTAEDGSTVHGVDLAWAAAEDNVGVTGYRIRRGGEIVGETAATSWNDTPLAASTEYQYTVEALDAAGNASPERAVSVRTLGTDTTAPSVPTGLQHTTASSTSIELTWTASTDNVGVTGYEVVRDGSVVGTPTDPEFVDTVGGPSETHQYSVLALDAAGNRSDPSEAITAQSLNLDPPEPAQDLQAQVVGSDVQLQWTAPASGVPVVGYDVVRDGEKLGEADGTSWTDTPPASFATHVYEVTSFSAAGVRAATAARTEVTIGDAEPPIAPTGTSASAAGPSSITVSWAGASDNVGVTEYRISRGGTQVGTVAATSTSWMDTGLLSETTYSYTVRAADAAGNVSDESPAASATTSGAAPQVATADAYANSSSPTTNYGTATALRLDADPDRRPYIALPVGSGQGTIARARLRVYVQSKVTAGFTVHPVAGGWTERGLTWNNAPAPGAAIASSGPVAAAGWVELDVTALTTGLAPGATVHLALRTTSATSVSVSSRETAQKPTLLLDWTG